MGPERPSADRGVAAPFSRASGCRAKGWLVGRHGPLPRSEELGAHGRRAPGEEVCYSSSRMTQILAGATLERPPGPKYVASLPYAELTFPSSWPKLATLAKWRKTAPGLELGVVAPYGVRTGEKGALGTWSGKKGDRCTDPKAWCGLRPERVRLF